MSVPGQDPSVSSFDGSLETPPVSMNFNERLSRIFDQSAAAQLDYLHNQEITRKKADEAEIRSLMDDNAVPTMLNTQTMLTKQHADLMRQLQDFTARMSAPVPQLQSPKTNPLMALASGLAGLFGGRMADVQTAGLGLEQQEAQRQYVNSQAQYEADQRAATSGEQFTQRQVLENEAAQNRNAEEMVAQQNLQIDRHLKEVNARLDRELEAQKYKVDSEKLDETTRSQRATYLQHLWSDQKSVIDQHGELADEGKADADAFVDKINTELQSLGFPGMPYFERGKTEKAKEAAERASRDTAMTHAANVRAQAYKKSVDDRYKVLNQKEKDLVAHWESERRYKWATLEERSDFHNAEIDIRHHNAVEQDRSERDAMKAEAAVTALKEKLKTAKGFRERDKVTKDLSNADSRARGLREYANEVKQSAQADSDRLLGMRIIQEHPEKEAEVRERFRKAHKDVPFDVQ